MLELEYEKFMDIVEKNPRNQDKRHLHYLDESDKITLYIKSSDYWEYVTIVPKEKIYQFGQQYNVSEEQAIIDFKRSVLRDAIPLKEKEVFVDNLPEELQKGRVIAIGPRGGRIVGYNNGEPIYEGSPQDTGTKKPPKQEEVKPDHRTAFQVLGEVTKAKKITVEPIYTEKLKDKWSGKNVNVRVRPMTIDGHKMWFVLRNKKAILFVKKPLSGTEISPARDFESRIYDSYLRAERQRNILEIESNDKSFTKDLDAGEDMVEEAADYESFLIARFDKWEKAILSFLDKTLEDELLKDVNYMNKSFGEFLRQLFNNVNTLGFRRGLVGTIKATLKQGVNEAEKELNMDIGFGPEMMTEAKVLTDRQLEGFYIENKRWEGLKGVAEDVQLEISQIVRDGIVDRTGMKQIREQIQGKMEMTKTRATMIARTETNRFMSSAKLSSYKKSGIVKAVQWDSFLDNRTSSICRELDQKIVPLGKYFDVDVKEGLKVKHYTFDHPPGHPNCRSIINPIFNDED